MFFTTESTNYAVTTDIFINNSVQFGKLHSGLNEQGTYTFTQLVGNNKGNGCQAKLNQGELPTDGEENSQYDYQHNNAIKNSEGYPTNKVVDGINVTGTFVDQVTGTVGH